MGFSRVARASGFLSRLCVEREREGGREEEDESGIGGGEGGGEGGREGGRLFVTRNPPWTN